MKIREKIEKWVKETLGEEGDFVLVHPKEIKNGDFSLIVSVDTAEKDFEKLKGNLIGDIEQIEFVAPRFINIYLSKTFFADSVLEINEKKETYDHNNLLEGQKIIIEYTNTNVLKPLHIGHLMGNIIGQSLSNLLEANGAEVRRNTYQGDSGLHIAKAVWGIQKLGGIKEGSSKEKAIYIGEAYTLGANKYEEDAEAQLEIKEINKKIFEKSDDNLMDIYKWGREVSLAHFEELYKKLNTKFDYYFFESEVADEALMIVKEFLKAEVFEESEGAIVFKGEKFDPKLHTRVFVSSQGLPMYEAKDIAHAIRKENIYKSDKSIIVTANEQNEYFKVVLKALEKINPKISEKTKHLAHGILKLSDGKMSSRKGNVITGESLIKDTENLVLEKIADRDFDKNQKEEIAEIVAIGAIKYSILRQAIGGDIIFDFDKSISFEGDSGPYLQYTYVRANSILQKSEIRSTKSPPDRVIRAGEIKTERPEGFEITELERFLYRFPEVVEKSGSDYAPHTLVTYLIDLASAFNSFYANEQILDDSDNSNYKLLITQAVGTVLKNGLALLGIKVPERM